MKKKDKGTGENKGLPPKADQQAQELRRQAEQAIRQQDALSPVDLENITPEERQKLLYELQVHEVELTMQNEELRASQVKLEESRSRYFELYDLAPVGYLTVSEQGFITLANLTVAALLGVERSALINTPLSRYILKEDQDIYYRHRNKLFESGKDQQCELRMVKADGAVFWAKLQANLMQDETDEPQCRVVLSDISERIINEEMIKQQQIVLSAIYENTPLILMLVDSERKVQKINSYGATFADKEMEDILGKRGGEALGCLYALEHPEGCGKGPHCAECIVRLTVLDTIETGRAYHQIEASLPFLVNGVKEQLYFLLSTVRLLVNEQQQVLVSMLDITDLKKIEEALHMSEERFRVAQEVSPDGFTILHPLRNEKGEIIDFTWVYENQAIARINKTDPQEVIDKKLLDLFPDHSGTAIFEAYIHVANTRKPQIFEEVYVREIVSKPTWLRMIIVPMAEDIAVFAMDISERKRAEAATQTLNAELEQRVKDRTIELEAINKELASFAYSISHDFRTPLRALDGFSASLIEKYNDQLDEQGLHYLNRIRNAAIYMSNLVDDLLKLSRVIRTELNNERVNISRLASEALTELQESEPTRKVEVIIAANLTAKGDPHLLRSAMDNLLGNAWKFSSKEEQAKIEVGRSTIDGEEAFFVRDNGVGFNMTFADKLFGAFQRLHGADEFPGTGIGLATVQRIISRHGGKVWADSEEGKGATFYFTLPG